MTVAKIAVKKKPPQETEHATVPVRVSPTVHSFIISKAKWGESINRTLRRILKIADGWAPENGGSRP